MASVSEKPATRLTVPCVITSHRISVNYVRGVVGNVSELLPDGADVNKVSKSSLICFNSRVLFRNLLRWPAEVLLDEDIDGIVSLTQEFLSEECSLQDLISRVGLSVEKIEAKEIAKQVGANPEGIRDVCLDFSDFRHNLTREHLQLAESEIYRMYATSRIVFSFLKKKKFSTSSLKEMGAYVSRYNALILPFLITSIAPPLWVLITRLALTWNAFCRRCFESFTDSSDDTAQVLPWERNPSRDLFHVKEAPEPGWTLD